LVNGDSRDDACDINLCGNTCEFGYKTDEVTGCGTCDCNVDPCSTLNCPMGSKCSFTASKECLGPKPCQIQPICEREPLIILYKWHFKICFSCTSSLHQIRKWMVRDESICASLSTCHPVKDIIFSISNAFCMKTSISIHLLVFKLKMHKALYGCVRVYMHVIGGVK